MGLRGHGLDGPTYQMREKVFAIGDDFWIEDQDGRKVYKVNGKVARVRDTWILEDREGHRVAEIREMGRATQGVTLIAIDEGTRLSGVQRVVEGDGDEDPADVGEAAPPAAGAAPGADSPAD